MYIPPSDSFEGQTASLAYSADAFAPVGPSRMLRASNAHPPQRAREWMLPQTPADRPGGCCCCEFLCGHGFCCGFWCGEVLRFLLPSCGQNVAASGSKSAVTCKMKHVGFQKKKCGGSVGVMGKCCGFFGHVAGKTWGSWAQKVASMGAESCGRIMRFPCVTAHPRG
eukprot:gene15613-biopygen681